MADPRSLDAVELDNATRCLRLAPDDLLVLGPAPALVSGVAVVFEAETGLCSAWVSDRAALAALCPWPLPVAGVARGGICGIGVILLVRHDGVLVIVEAALARDLADRLATTLPVAQGAS